MEPLPDQADLAEELKRIREAIERYRRSSVWSFVLSTLTIIALVVSISAGVITQIADQNNEERDQDNLVRLVRTGCEDNNDRTVRDAEVLIATVSTSEMTEEERQRIAEYRKNVQDSLTDCDARVAIITGD